MTDFSGGKAAPQTHPRPSSPGAAILLIGIMFLDRFSFYGMRSFLFIYMNETLEAVPNMPDSSILYSASFLVAVLIPVIAGMVLDHLIEKPMGITLGASLVAVGMLLLIAHNTWLILLGITLVTVGSSFTKVGFMASLGFTMPEQGARIAGLYWLTYAVINLAAFASGIFIFRLFDKFGADLCLVLMAVMAMTIAALSGLGRSTGLLKTETELLQRQPRSTGATLGGFFVVAMVVATAFLLIALFVFVDQDSSIMQWLIIAPILFVLLAASIAMFATASSLRATLLIVGMGLLSMFLFALMELQQTLHRNQFGADVFDISPYLELLANLAVTLLLGIVFLLSNARGNAGMRAVAGVMVAGVALMLLSVVAGLGAAAVGLPAIGGSILLGAAAEAFLVPAIHATGWHLAPNFRKGTAFGIVLGFTGFSGMLANLFSGYDPDFGTPGESLLPGIGLFAFTIILLGLGVAVWLGLRGQPQAVEMDENPFA
jgi:hypothetical protein